jgi:4-hydroxythreonine-4-phosphate dehydrogenase
MGDPAGIGPEIALKAAQAQDCQLISRLVILGDLATLRETAQRLGSRIELIDWSIEDPYPEDHQRLPVITISQLTPQQRTPGQPTPAGGDASYRYVEAGIQLALDNVIQGLATAPISKAMWHAAGRDYPGHTELLADLTQTQDVRMMLAGSQLRVILVTTHIPFAQVPAALSIERIHTTIRLAAEHLKQFHGLANARLAVAGLNPHAGEGGAFGDEEERIIAPAIKQAHEQGGHREIWVDGPFPADSVFVRAVDGEFDGVICLYHDQGLIPLKLLSWTDGVNVTIGLPIVRTSPDHGTAFDIAGQGKADSRSMQAAIRLAAEMTRRREEGRVV